MVVGAGRPCGAVGAGRPRGTLSLAGSVVVVSVKKSESAKLAVALEQFSRSQLSFALCLASHCVQLCWLEAFRSLLAPPF